MFNPLQFANPMMYVRMLSPRNVVDAVFGVINFLMTPLYESVTRLFYFLWDHPVGAKIRDLAGDNDVMGKLDALAKKHVNSKEVDEGTRLLIAGDRLSYAKTIIDPVTYSWAYKDVPEDLRRSLAADGRLVGGAPLATNIAASAITPKFISDAWKRATRDAAHSSLVLAIGMSLLVLGGIAYALKVGNPTANTMAGEVKSYVQDAAKSAERRELEVLTNDAIRESTLRSLVKHVDIWDQSDFETYAPMASTLEVASVYANGDEAKIRAVEHRVAGATGVAVGILLTFAGLLAIGAALLYVNWRLTWTRMFRTFVHAGAVSSVAVVQRAAWRESIQRYAFRADTRDMALEGYNNQVFAATQLDKSPLIDLGITCGMTLFRGHLDAPERGTNMKISILDFNQHVFVSGKSGVGKTRNVIKPVLSQLFSLIRRAYPIGMVVMDEKADLHAEVMKLAAAHNLQDSVLVIGTGPNEYRVDLLGGLTPEEFGTVVTSVASQTGGEGGDSFWPQEAKDKIILGLRLLRAFECTTAGIRWAQSNGVRPYSIVAILKLLQNDEFLKEVLMTLALTLSDENGEYASIKHLAGMGLNMAMETMSNVWLPMVSQTKDGIKANANNMLANFLSSDELAKGFATGMGDRLISPRELVGRKIKVFNISQVVYGDAGRIVMVMLKTLWLKNKREVDLENPALAEMRQDWWRNQDRTLAEAEMDDMAMEFFIADEYQSMVTGGSDRRFNDSSCWNIIRSAGVCGLLVTQNIPSFFDAIGEVKTKKMIGNFGGKIFLQNDDEDTILFAKATAGQTMRFKVMGEDQFESIAAAKRISGVDVDALRAVELDDGVVMNHVNYEFCDQKFSIHPYRLPYGYDDRWFPASSSFNWRDQQAAGWRQDDKNLSLLQNGDVTADVLDDGALSTINAGYAYVSITRAGRMRMDVIRLHSA